MNEENNTYSDSSYSQPGGNPADSGSSGYTPPQQSQPAYSYEAPARETPRAAYAAPAETRTKKERRGMSAGAVIALCLVCALLAAAVSAGFTYAAARSGSRTVLGDALDSIVPTPVPVITTVSAASEGENPAVNDTAAAIYELAKQQVVGIRTDITYYNIFGQSTAASVSGSGVIISDDGYILTNHHVVEDAIQSDLDVTVMMYDETTYDAEIVGFDKDNDLALLKVDAEGLCAAQLGESDELTVGQIVYAVGNPLGELTYSMTSGIVSATDRTITTESDVAMNVFQIDAAVNSGNSGGPVYNSLGQVIGIVSAKYSSTGVEGLGFAIPISEAAHIANQLLEYGYVTDRAYMGITTTTVTASIAETYGMVQGAYVNAVNEDSAAEKAGLQEGDIIIALDGESISGAGDLTSALKRYHAGDTVTVTVDRDDENVDLSLTLDAKPQETEEEDAQSQEDGNAQASGEPYQGGEPFQGGQPYSYGDMEDFFRQFFGFGF